MPNTSGTIQERRGMATAISNASKRSNTFLLQTRIPGTAMSQSSVCTQPASPRSSTSRCGMICLLYVPLMAFEFDRSGLQAQGNQNASGVLNEQTLGDDPSFSDYARDILHMTNVFREHMVPPIVGVGHSIGSAALIRLSCMHPRLFASLVLLDPILGMDTMATGQRLIPMAATKPDLFPSREVAQKGFKKAFKNWDERAFRRWMEFGLRDTPTLLYPEAGKVTLRTTKANEAWSYARTQLDGGNEDGTKSKTDWIKYPDADPAGRPFYRPEGLEAMEMLPRIRPDVLFVFPQYTAASPQSHDQNVAWTGVAIGGSGGAKEGKVAKALLKNAGHLCPFEVPSPCAQAISEWLGPDLKAWKDRVVYEREHRDDKSIDGIRLSERFIREAKQFSKTGSSSKNGKL